MTTSDVKAVTQEAEEIRVWDPLVRFGHWALVAVFAATYFSGEDEADPLHVWAGYIVGGLVALRVLWGFVGPARARFSDFTYAPKEDLRYLKDLLRGSARRYLGHSPAGGAMVIVLLIGLVATVVTGLIAYGEEGKRPLAQNGVAVTGPAWDRETDHAALRGGDASGESIIGGVHNVLANVTLGLVILHLLGVALASVVHHENLVLAMISGRKRPEDASNPTPVESPR